MVYWEMWFHQNGGERRNMMGLEWRGGETKVWGNQYLRI